MKGAAPGEAAARAGSWGLPEDTNRHFPKGGSSDSRNSWEPSPPSLLSLLPWYIFSITLVTILVLYTQNSWGQGFYLLCSLLYITVLEQCLCLLGTQWICPKHADADDKWRHPVPSCLCPQYPGESQSWYEPSNPTWDSHISIGFVCTGKRASHRQLFPSARIFALCLTLTPLVSQNPLTCSHTILFAKVMCLSYSGSHPFTDLRQRCYSWNHR